MRGKCVMKLYSDLSLNSNDLFEIKTLQLTPITGSSYDSSTDTTTTTPIGTIYLDSNITTDSVDDSNITTVPANLAKIGLKLKYRQFSDGDISTTDDGKFNWLSILGGYLAKEGTAPNITLIKRYNLDGGRLLNANTTPRFASELVCKSYVDGLIGGKFTKTFDCNGTDTVFAHEITGNVNTLTLYERTGTGQGGSYSYTIVLADISMVVTTANNVVTSVIIVTFAVAPAEDKYFELRGA